jgi:hypothetical protein
MNQDLSSVSHVLNQLMCGVTHIGKYRGARRVASKFAPALHQARSYMLPPTHNTRR